jgi:UDP-N-acetylglucosamine pyrophosphorylase
MDPVYYYPVIEDRGAPLPPEGTGNVTDILMAGIVIALTLTGIGYIAIRRGKGPS